MSYIRKGDLVIVITGEDRGKTGKVLKILSSKNAIIAEGINLGKKHRKKRKQQEPAGILTIEFPIALSNVSLYCPKCKKGVRVKINKTKGTKKKRICKKCQTVL